jgi:hypothetical protein
VIDLELPPRPPECLHGTVKACRRTQRDGREVIVEQCLDCGKWIRNLRKADHEHVVLQWDDSIAERSRELQHQLWEEYRAKLQQVRDDQNAQWWERYDEYLRSEAWQRKRRAVLKRDKTCQACLSAPAVQAHHTTYRHAFDEPLFDLVAVCVRCHDKITAMERAARETPS